MSFRIPEYFVALFVSFAVTVAVSLILIPILRAHKVGQRINESGPVWHASKAGTPMMGGLAFIFAMLLTVAGIFCISLVQGEDTHKLIPIAMVFFLAAGYGAIGFVDDYRKLIKKENEGLKSKEKLLWMLIVGGIYLAVMGVTGYLGTAVLIPFFDVSVELGWFFWPLALLCVAGMGNSTNITDGVDGLASTVTLIIAIFLSVVAVRTDDRNLEIVSAVIVGSVIGFLIFNHHPAKVFMGDTGSLFLGGLLMGTGFMMGNPIVLLIASLAFILDAVTSAIQIVAIRIFKTRVFSIAPFHHALEVKKWKEGRIVFLFGIFTIFVCILSYFAL